MHVVVHSTLQGEYPILLLLLGLHFLITIVSFEFPFCFWEVSLSCFLPSYAFRTNLLYSIQGLYVFAQKGEGAFPDHLISSVPYWL